MHLHATPSSQLKPARPTARLRGLVLPLLCIAGFIAGSATAQQVTDAQRSAIKSTCRNDFIAQCSGVTPGGREALACLQQHSASLSPACQKAISAIGTSPKKPAPSGSSSATPAPVPTPEPAPKKLSPRQEMAIVREACGPDYRAHCSAVPLGGGRAIACLRENAARLSPGCQKVLSSAR